MMIRTPTAMDVQVLIAFLPSAVYLALGVLLFVRASRLAHWLLPLPADGVECTSMLTLRHLLVSTDVIAALPMFIAVDDRELRILPTPLSSIRRSVGVTMLKERVPSAAAGVLLAHLREEGARLAALEREYARTRG